MPVTNYSSFMTSPAVAAVPQAGQLAPDFTLPSTAGSPVTLSALRGTTSVLLCFFPLAFSSVCTAEFSELRDAYDQFAARQVTVFPISVDSVYALKEFKAKHGMRFDLLSDFKREVSALYGTLLPDTWYSNRAYFLIDTQGTLRWVQVEPHPGLKRESAEILAAIAALG